jgi:hypothetical protein
MFRVMKDPKVLQGTARPPERFTNARRRVFVFRAGLEGQEETRPFNGAHRPNGTRPHKPRNGAENICLRSTS